MHEASPQVAVFDSGLREAQGVTDKPLDGGGKIPISSSQGLRLLVLVLLALAYPTAAALGLVSAPAAVAKQLQPAAALGPASASEFGPPIGAQAIPGLTHALPVVQQPVHQSLPTTRPPRDAIDLPRQLAWGQLRPSVRAGLGWVELRRALCDSGTAGVVSPFHPLRSSSNMDPSHVLKSSGAHSRTWSESQLVSQGRLCLAAWLCEGSG